MKLSAKDFLKLLRAQSDRSDDMFDLQRLRRDVSQMGEKTPIPKGVKVETTVLGGVSCLRFQPEKATPVRHILYFHGGGYAAGNPNSHAGLSALISKRAQAVVWSVDYRLAPKHPYPAALDDAVEAYVALLEQVGSANKIAIAGDSAGGGLSMALLLRLKRDGPQNLPCAAAFFSPWVDLTLSGKSYQSLAERDPIVTRNSLTNLSRLYAGESDLSHEFISPRFGNLVGLPDLLIHVGSEEVLLSDSIMLAERAGEAGVSVELKIWPDMVHIFQMYFGLIEEAQKSVAETCNWFVAKFERT